MNHNRALVSPGSRFEAAMLERYHCGTTCAVNPMLQRTTPLLLSIESAGISVAVPFAAKMLHFWFGGSPEDFHVRPADAGKFEFEVASPDVAAEIALVGFWAAGPLQVSITMPPKPTGDVCAALLHARHDAHHLSIELSGTAGRAVRRDLTGLRGSLVSGVVRFTVLRLCYQRPWRKLREVRCLMGSTKFLPAVTAPLLRQCMPTSRVLLLLKVEILKIILPSCQLVLSIAHSPVPVEARG
jgi:hypothetical protein